MFVIYLQQTVDEMGEVLDVRRRGRHICSCYAQLLPDVDITSTAENCVFALLCFWLLYLSALLGKLQICRYITFIC